MLEQRGLGSGIFSSDLLPVVKRRCLASFTPAAPHPFAVHEYDEAFDMLHVH